MYDSYGNQLAYSLQVVYHLWAVGGGGKVLIAIQITVFLTYLG